jgi:RNA polymerase sigma-32 factor
MEQRLYAHDQAYDSANSDNEDDTYSPSVYLPSPDADPAQLLENEDWDGQNRSALTAALKVLDERSLDILQSRWLAEKKTTLHDLADRYGISAERVRQVEGNAIKKLRAAMQPI